MSELFVDRENELEFLEDVYKNNDSSLVILYGRRRVGKTELVSRFAKSRPAIYFLADERTDQENLKELQKSMAEFLKDTLFGKAEIKDWVELFEEFSKKLDKKAVVIIDEFPYLIRANKAMPSIFQKIWDTNFSKKNVCLILLGSSISMMEEHTLAYQAPLYGRRSGQIELKPLKLKRLKEFFPENKIEEVIQFYSVVDGIPLYALKLNPKAGLLENLEENVFKIGKFLYPEAENLLKQELREPAKYFLILKSIGFGRNRFGEIANFTGLDKTTISKYLDNLLTLHIIKKDFPVTQNKETRNASYVFEDNYFNFWFRFVYPNKTLIEEHRQKDLIGFIKTDLELYVSHIFEKACTEFVFDIDLPIKFNKIGRWWHKDKEIDIVCLDESKKEVLFVECKWSYLKEKGARKVLEELKEKSKFVEWERKKEYFGLFGKKILGKEILRKEGFYVWDLEDIEKALE